jgi:hypothetical protein
MEDGSSQDGRRGAGEMSAPHGAGLLGIYLNDHLAGATAGTERARRMTRAYEDGPLGTALGPLADEIAEDRVSLVRIMRRLGIPVRRYKVWAGRAVERVGRLKSNGRIVRQSPLSAMWELEALRLGVEGKAAAWETLRIVAGRDGRLDHDQLTVLLDRARAQRDLLEELRREQAGTTFLDE